MGRKRGRRRAQANVAREIDRFKAPPKATKKADCGTSELEGGGFIGLEVKSAAKAKKVKMQPATRIVVAVARICRVF